MINNTLLLYCKRLFLIIINLLLLFSLSSCFKEVHNVGYKFSDTDISKIIVGKTSKDFVITTLGSPSTKSDFGKDTWYYVYSKYESKAFLQPKLKNRRIMVIEFADNNIVDNIKNYTEADARKIAFSKDETKIDGRDTGVIQQLLGNVGRFNAPKQAAER